jgi:branched-chain amino acid transport system substrate-binding protein
MMEHMKQFFGYIFVLASLFGLAGCDQKSSIQPSGKKIKIGVIAPFSGSQRAKGIEGLLGIKAAMQLQPYINNGDAVELLVEDDMGDSAHTLKALKKLVEIDQVAAVLLLSDSNPALVVSRIADNYKTPILSLFATHPHITKGSKFISQLVFDSTFQGEVAALFIRDELLIDRVAVFTNPESANSIYLSSEFIRKFESVDGVVIDNILLADENDYVAILESIRDKDPELLYFPVEAEKVLGLAKAARKMNWMPIMIRCKNGKH